MKRNSRTAMVALWSFGLAAWSTVCGVGCVERDPEGGDGAGHAVGGEDLGTAEQALEACVHPRCTTGEPLAPTCDPCVAQICAVDPFCCDVRWDAPCVEEINTVCGLGGVCANGYIVTARHSGSCVSVTGAGTADDVAITQFECSNEAHFRFTLEEVFGLDPGYSLRAVNSGLCVDVLAENPRSGAAVVQRPCHSGQNQTFRLSYLGGGYYNLTAAHSGLCLTVASGNVHDGAALTQLPCGRSNAQKFRFDF